MALDHGITWFDTAPPYGDGQAEALLGACLKGRRTQAVICTKVGIARPRTDPAKAWVRSMLRPLVKAAPGLRSLVAKGRGPAQRTPLTGASVTASLEASLRDLQTDCVDVLALHDPSMEDVVDHNVLSALDAAVTSGKARAISVAGAPDVALQGLLGSEVFRVVQFPFDAFTPVVETVKGAAPEAFCAIHSVLGSGGLQRAIRAVREVPRIAAALADTGYVGPSGPSDFLLDMALAENEDGVVLMSMFRPENIQRNVRRASGPVRAEAMRSLKAILQDGANGPQ